MAYIGQSPKVKRLRVTPQNATPTNELEGDVFYSDGTVLNEGLYVRKNGVWEKIASGGTEIGIFPDDNMLINGDFFHDQRFDGTLQSAGLAYGIDRWLLSGSGTSQRVSVTGETFQFAAQSVTTAGTSLYRQRIRSDISFPQNGVELTFSVKIKVSSGSWSADVPKVRIHSADAVDDFSATTLVSTVDLDPADAGSTTPTGTFRRFSGTFTVNSTMATNGFHVEFGDFTSQTATNQYGEAHLAPTPADNSIPVFTLATKSHADELLKCKEYYREIGNSLIGAATSASNVRFMWTSDLEMRTSPTVAILKTNPTVNQVTSNFTGSSSTIAASFNLSPHSAGFDIDGFTGMTVDKFTFMNDSADEIVSLTAEL